MALNLIPIRHPDGGTGTCPEKALPLWEAKGYERIPDVEVDDLANLTLPELRKQPAVEALDLPKSATKTEILAALRDRTATDADNLDGGGTVSPGEEG